MIRPQPHLHLLTGKRETAALPQHPDERLGIALKAAWQAGHDEAERTQYMTGWRRGIFDGLVTGCALGAGLVAAALHFGLITGGL